MENIEKILNQVSKLDSTFTQNGIETSPLIISLQQLYPAAREEFEALKKAGITIRKVETITVEGPARKRGRKSK